MLGAHTDVTPLKEAERKSTELTERLARSNADLEQFAYLCSHDLQAPIRAIIGYTKILKKRLEGKFDEDTELLCDRTMRAATNMQALIENLLAFSSIDNKGGTFVATNCGAVLDDALNNLHSAITESGATITVDALPTVSADRVQISRVFQNLLENAIKFSGDSKPEIHVSSKKDGNMRVFSIRDHGIGIDDKYIEQIFQIFQRLHTREKYPGTGIGLALCKKVVERHGGRIWVEKPPQGNGTIFCFTLPSS